MLTDPEPLLPTRGYRMLCHDATLIDFEAEGMWPRAHNSNGRSLRWSSVCCVSAGHKRMTFGATTSARLVTGYAVRRQYGDAGADQVPAGSP